MTTIEQKPLYTQLPVGQEVIFVVSNNNIYANQTNVRFIAEVHISNETPPNINTTTDVVGTFKSRPNNAGVGIFDFRQIVEYSVAADNMGAILSTYKGTVATFGSSVTEVEAKWPMHLIDKYSRNINSMRWMAIVFKTQYTDASGVVQIVDPQPSEDYKIFNSYLKYTDVLTMGTAPNENDFGFDLDAFTFSANTDKFLTNAPTTQYANLDDYGTLAYLSPNDDLHQIRFRYLSSTGSVLGTENVDRDVANGAYAVFSSFISNHLYFFGCFPANLRNWSTTFRALVTAGTIDGGSIQVGAYNVGGSQISQQYTIKVNCPDLKGFESIRLCWLNQWGAWDYYTFTKKSTRSITTTGSTYEQLAGSWNKGTYRVDSYKGGKKAFRVNATEKITMNSDFVGEDENVMFEELINSPEVYILKGYQDITETNSALNQYVIPVRLTTSSFTKKTIANDKLIQYTFEVEKSKTLRTQSV